LATLRWKYAHTDGITIANFDGMRKVPLKPFVLGMTVGLCMATAAALHGQSSTSTSVWRIRDAPAELRPAISRADLVIATIHDALLWELNSAMEEGGEILATKSCHVDATWIAQRVGRAEGVAAGRTSDRLRNPANAPRAWAAPIVEANAGRRVRDVDGFAVDLGNKVGVIRPIAQRPICTGCHGQPAKFNTAVRADLRERYPGDRATGFEVGDIRGWYWVEIPKLRH
jgi:hypothetical protein